MASTYLSRATSAGNRRIATFSAWIKKSNITAEQVYFYGNSTSPALSLYTNGDGLRLSLENGNFLYSNNLLRDTSGWYHIVYSIDTTQATASDRFKMYINGTQVTSFLNSSYPTQNFDINMNLASQNMYVGGIPGGANFDGSMSHVHFIDGTAYDASAFGEYDTNGVWKIKTSPSVTYGTNGFFILKDGNSVTDQSPNTNNFTVGGGTLTNTEDSPSNVFATLNALNKGSAITLANGNLAWTQSASWNGVTGTLGMSVGKYYWEIKAGGVNPGGAIVVGVAGVNFDITSEPGSGTDSWRYRSDDGTKRNSTSSAYGDTWTSGDIIGIALDLDNSAIWFSKNGVWQNSATISEIENGTTTNSAFTNINELVVPVVGTYNSSSASYMNFGNGYFGTTAVASAGTNTSGIGIFEYDVPAGYTALCTKGLNL